MSAAALPKKKSGVTVADLPDSPPPGVHLYCSACRETYSACRGDYFFCASDEVLRCECNDTPLALVKREVRVVPWSKP